MGATQRTAAVSAVRRGDISDAERKVRALLAAAGEHGARSDSDVHAAVRIGGQLARAGCALSALAHLVAGTSVPQLVLRERRRAAPRREGAGADDPPRRRDASRGAERNASGGTQRSRQL